jgi:hypothetical protein
MRVFFDSSAFAKRFREEAGSDEVEALCISPALRNGMQTYVRRLTFCSSMLLWPKVCMLSVCKT